MRTDSVKADDIGKILITTGYRCRQFVLDKNETVQIKAE